MQFYLLVNYYKPQPHLHLGRTPLFMVNLRWTREFPDILGGQAIVILALCDFIYY